MLFYISCLYLGISLKRIGGFGYILFTAYIAQSEYLKIFTEYGSYLFKFMSVIGGKHYFSRHERYIL